MDKFWENYIKTRPADSKGAFDAFKKMHQEPRTMAQGSRTGFKDGNGVYDEKELLGKRVNELMDEGYEFGEAVKQAMKEGYAEGGRVPFSYAGVVKQGPQTGMHKYLNFYSKKQAKELGKGAATAEWFKTKKAMNAALKKRKETTGRGLTDAELTKKHKKELTKRGFDTWSEAPDKVKRSITAQVTPSALAKKEKLPKWKEENLTTRVNEETRKLLAEKKPINPRTGLPYTLKEYTALTEGQKTKLLARLKGKVKTRPWAKRQGWYPEKKANKLMTYLKHAAKKQENLPFKERNFISVWEGEKFVGVKDVRKNTLWTHVDYDLTGKKNAKVITDHPGNKNIQFFLKKADEFKYATPDKLLGSYFTKYKRVPTYSEMYRFFTVDPQSVGAKSGKAYKFNPLQQHHQELMAKEPAKSIQLTLSKQNTEASRILNQFEKGKYSFAEADKKLKELGVRIKSSQGWMGPKSGEITAAKSIEAAKKETVQMFKTAVKNNPEIVDQMAKALNLNEKQKIKLNTRLNSGIPLDTMANMLSSDFKIPVGKIASALGKVLKVLGPATLPLDVIPFAEARDLGIENWGEVGGKTWTQELQKFPRTIEDLIHVAGEGTFEKFGDKPEEDRLFTYKPSTWGDKAKVKALRETSAEDLIARIEAQGEAAQSTDVAYGQQLLDPLVSEEEINKRIEKALKQKEWADSLPPDHELVREEKKEKTIDPFVSIFDPIPKMEFAGGGMAEIRRPSAIPPESGPQSQGLASLKKYGSYY